MQPVLVKVRPVRSSHQPELQQQKSVLNILRWSAHHFKWSHHCHMARNASVEGTQE